MSIVVKTLKNTNIRKSQSILASYFPGSLLCFCNANSKRQSPSIVFKKETDFACACYAVLTLVEEKLIDLDCFYFNERRIDLDEDVTPLQLLVNYRWPSGS